MPFPHLPKPARVSIWTALSAVPGARPIPVRGMSRIGGAVFSATSRLGSGIVARLPTGVESARLNRSRRTSYRECRTPDPVARCNAPQIDRFDG